MRQVLILAPYRFGGTTRSGIDCSAFVLNVFGESTGIELPRVAAEQAELGDKVENKNFKKEIWCFSLKVEEFLT
jgi:lipoprotein Spr